MEFFKNLANSFYKPDFYSQVIKKPVSYSFKNFFLFALILGLILAAVCSFIYIPKIKIFLDNVGTQIVNIYPSELKIEIKNGVASANVQQPYFIKVPAFFNQGSDKTKQLENLIVIDTNNEFSTEKFNEYKTAAVLNKSSITTLDNQSGLKVLPLKDVKSFSLDKQMINSLFDKIKPLFKFVYPVFSVGAFIAIFLGISLHLVYLFFGALLIWIIAKINKVQIGYWKSYQVGMHMMMPAILITTVTGFFHFTFPFFLTLLIILIAVFNLKNIENPTQIEPAK